MGAALILLLVGLGGVAAGVLIGRYYVPDDRQLRRTARHSRAYMRALSYLVAREHEQAIGELRAVVEENVDDVEPYFALGAIFRSRGEHERAIRVHQALALRERERKKLRQRAMYELGLDFRAAGMPRRATKAMEEVLIDDTSHDGALRVLAALYEEQARFNEAATLWQRIGKRRGEDVAQREHHLLVAAAQTALARGDLDSAKQLLKAAQKHEASAHFYAAAAELAAARGNHRGAKQRLTQALLAEPALAPHLLPGLVAAEHGLAGGDGGRGHDDELGDDASASASLPRALAAGSSVALPASAASAEPAVGPVVEATEAAIEGGAVEKVSGEPAMNAPSSDAGAVAGGEASVVAGGEASVVAGGEAHAAASDEASAVVGGEPGAAGLATSTVGATTAGEASAEGDAAAARALVAASTVVPVARAVAGEAVVAAHVIAEARGEPLVAARVLAVLDEVEAQTGPRLELALIRAQLVPMETRAARVAFARALIERFPESLAARVAAARIAVASGDDAAIRAALDGLVADDGALAWTLRGRWQCAHCGHRPGAFGWRCAQCRRWGTLRMETGIEPPPVAPRERRSASRSRLEAALGVDATLPAATLDPGLSDAELASAGVRRSLLGRVGGWVSGALRRES